MIAKAKSISHGINDIRYITGETENKEHPERIFHVRDNLLQPGLDATGIWESMKLAASGSPRVRNTVIRIELSPAPEHTKDFSLADWRKLWDEFVDEFDGIELLDKNGKTYSPKTNLKGSRARCGCTRNPTAASRTSTAHTAASTRTDVSTTTTTYTCGRSGQPSEWP